MHLVPDKIGIKKPSAYITFSDPVRTLGMVRMTGIEPAHQRYQILSLARLPIPPHPQKYIKVYHICFRMSSTNIFDFPHYPYTLIDNISIFLCANNKFFIMLNQIFVIPIIIRRSYYENNLDTNVKSCPVSLFMSLQATTLR